MTNEEQKYVNGLKTEITRLEDELKLRTEEKEQALALAWKYIDKYVKDNNLTDEVLKGAKNLFNRTSK